MEEPETTMVEVRQEELIVSLTSHNQNPSSTTATAHFLKPIHSFNETHLPKLPSHCLSSLEPKALPLRISFHGWRCRAKNWSSWIEKMASLHESTWRKAGIYEAIMNSSYHVKRNNDLILSLAERWCCKTKCFVFSWGETSVTPEDAMILGGFSLLGSPVFAPVETKESRRAKESLRNARIEIVRSKAKKACPRLWMSKFKDSGQPRLSRWHDVSCKVENVRLALESACLPLKKSKSVSEILEEKQVGNKLAKNPKGNKKNESTKTSKRKKDDNESASHALVCASSRLSIRSSKKPAHVTRDEEASSDTALHALASANTKNTRIALPNLDGKETADSPEDNNNNPTIAEMMRSCKKRGKVEPKDYDEDGNPSSHSQSLSSTIADDEVIKYFEPLAILAEQVIHDDSVLRGESKPTIKCANEDNPKHQICETISIDDVEGECGCYAVDMPGLKLEAQISRLEKLVEELKAMRSASK